MKRLLHLWLPLLGAFWLVRAGVASLLYGRLAQGRSELLALIAIPALQAVALAWATRQPATEEASEVRLAPTHPLPAAGEEAKDAEVAAEQELDSGPPPAYKRSHRAGRKPR